MRGRLNVRWGGERKNKYMFNIEKELNRVHGLFYSGQSEYLDTHKSYTGKGYYIHYQALKFTIEVIPIHYQRLLHSLSNSLTFTIKVPYIHCQSLSNLLFKYFTFTNKLYCLSYLDNITLWIPGVHNLLKNENNIIRN